MIPNPFAKISGNAKAYSLKENDLRLILDQIQNPALLINLEKKTVVASNFQFTELTSIGSDEITQLDIQKVIIDCDFEKLNDGVSNFWSIARKNKNPVSAEIQTTYISDDENLALLTVRSEKKLLDSQESITQKLLHESVQVQNNISNMSLDDLILAIIESGLSILHATSGVYYSLEKNQGNVRKIVSSGETVFPELIPSVELRRFKQVNFWEPGKRVLSEIHRVGRLNHFQEIITIPVNPSEDKKGLLVLVFKDQQFQGAYEKVVEVFAEWIVSVVKLHQSLEMFNQDHKSVAVEIDQYEQFYENASDCAVVLNNENIIMDFNSNMSNFLKYSPIELLNQKASVIFENSEIASSLEKKIESTLAALTKPVVVFDRLGNRIPVFYKIVPIEIMGTEKKLLIIRDASIEVEAQKKIKQFENKAAIGEVVADFAHEVRNPIHSFVSGIQIMKKKIDQEDPLWKTLDRMHEDCLRINDLMESILSYSRQKVENFKDVNLELLLKRIISSMNSKFSRSNVKAFVESKTEQRTIYADQRSIEQAFINLITNAYDAIKADGGVISIQIDRKSDDDPYLEISVSDTGPGIPPEIREKLFEPFVTDKPKGTGLGLAITKRMIEAHNGKIDLETYPGGTIFKVRLPIQEYQGEQA